jgi:sulfide dehydrogenase cytochrome subunit
MDLVMFHHRRPLQYASLTTCAWLALAGDAYAQSAATLRIESLAASCAGCHGTNGRAAAGSALPRLAGIPRDRFVAQMRAFQENRRPATVMHQIARGYDAEQIDELAAYFERQGP